MSIKRFSDQRLFERLIEYLFENMQHGYVDVKNISTVLALSPSQLNRRVKASTGLSISTFIMRTRLDEAKRLLQDYPEVSVNEVANRCGFADTAHFGHVFHRYEGMSPTEYARNHNSDPKAIMSFIHQQMEKRSAKR